ncbi:hypothetical protein [Rhizobium tumorigenes]|uniref:hypothetical protein n=1 Tax=Rhizobium tumorigenes TaxID=2041385 RepID=UPI00241DD3B2|nr:hypothetical protein [Rhizobium tumorigenes]WFS02217.1 hypothetical protein PR016_06280 [Rhizobium tumorigenes]
MNFADPANLPNSTSEGPEDWSDKFSKLASTTSDAQQLIENTNSDRTILETIYDRRIKSIAELTGQTLENPIHSLPGVPAFLQPRDRPLYALYEQRFAKQAQAIGDQHPELGPQFQSLTSGVDDEMNQMRRDAEKAASNASNDPTLDPISGFAAKLAGGLAGAARDPFQWQMAVMGGGGSGGATVMGRIGKTMLQEGLLNGGQEAVLQAASQERKKAAGLEYGMKDALTNVGVAATFGALFGGTIEGGHALAKIYGMGAGGAEAAARVMDGAPQPGDVEMVAKAMNVDLHPDQVSMLNRSFEDKMLDETFFPTDPTPEQGRVVEAALRHAEDPDNFPPPEIVERAIADEQAGPARTLSADDYERIYGGDPDAIDNLHGVMQAESLDDAARLIDDQTRSPSAETVAPDQVFDAYHGTSSVFSEFSREHLGANTGAKSAEKAFFFAKSPETAHSYFRDNKLHMDDGQVDPEQFPLLSPEAKDAIRQAQSYHEDAVDYGRAGDDDGYVRYSDLADQHWKEAWAIAEQDLAHGNNIHAVRLRMKNPLVKDFEGKPFRDESYAEVIDRAIAEGHDGVVFRNTFDGGPVDDIYAVLDPSQIRSRYEPLVDPLEGQTIRPANAAEPVDDAAMRSAEEQAGEIVNPVIDADGNPQSLLDFIPIQDRDGNVRLVSTAQALEIADQGNRFADLLEACKL